jgi:hypothetical protein
MIKKSIGCAVWRTRLILHLYARLIFWNRHKYISFFFFFFCYLQSSSMSDVLIWATASRCKNPSSFWRPLSRTSSLKFPTACSETSKYWQKVTIGLRQVYGMFRKSTS